MVNTGTFKLAGAQWTIIFEEGFGGDGLRWKKDYPTHTITVFTKYEGETTPYSKVERSTWDAIIFIILANTMIEKEDMSSYVSGFSLLIHQVFKNIYLNFYNDKVEGNFVIGYTTYYIVTDNITCMKGNIHGKMNPNMSLITLQTIDPRSGRVFNKEFTKQILYHEIVHAINAELGYSESKQDKEPFVNILSSFLFEVMSTLNINFNSSDGADKEVTQPK